MTSIHGTTTRPIAPVPCSQPPMRSSRPDGRSSPGPLHGAMAIGVFDSGMGGLSVHHALVARLPTADFVYLADQANTPYGGRSGEEIVEPTRAGNESPLAPGWRLGGLAREP